MNHTCTAGILKIWFVCIENDSISDENIHMKIFIWKYSHDAHMQPGLKRSEVVRVFGSQLDENEDKTQILNNNF